MSLPLTRSPLLDLPFELRQMVFEYVFCIDTSNALAAKPRNRLGLLLACRQIHDEALPCYRSALQTYTEELLEQMKELKLARDHAGDFGTILTSLCLEGIYKDRIEQISRQIQALQRKGWAGQRKQQK